MFKNGNPGTEAPEKVGSTTVGGGGGFEEKKGKKKKTWRVGISPRPAADDGSCSYPLADGRLRTTARNE